MRLSHLLRSPKRALPVTALLLAGLLAILTPGCGGGSGGEAAGRGLSLLTFSMDGVDNAVLNQELEFKFSGPVDPASITGASIQIREGPSYGASVPGEFFVDGSTVRFEPRLPSLCDQSDAAFKPDTAYRVQVIGAPEEFAVRNTASQKLSDTSTHGFSTRIDSDPDKFADQIPGVGPVVASHTPTDGAEAVAVAGGNKIEIFFSENLAPCTVNDSTVRFYMYETGDAEINNTVTSPVSGNESGFYVGSDTSDQVPSDPTTWGASVSTTRSPAQKILARIELVQTFSETKIVITPLAGYSADASTNAPVFPENALLVVELTAGITDFGNLLLAPTAFSFTTENLDSLSGQYVIANEGETPYVEAASTADVNTPRAPGRVQGFMLFSGDADNGAVLESPSGPESIGSGCTALLQQNDGTKDPFDPADGFLLDTGATFNDCTNQTDGSTAVVWEFQTFKIRSGVTVRIVGVNPAIILVEGDVVIESGGKLLVRGDGNAGSTESDGTKGRDMYNQSDLVIPGGEGVAGGGDGGDATKVEGTSSTFKYGHDGLAGYGSEEFDPGMPQVAPNPDNSTVQPLGAGQGGAPCGTTSSSNPWDGGSEAGGGGGHSTPGAIGEYNYGTPANYKLQLTRRAGGGEIYGEDNDPLLTPFAGSGGGAAGLIKGTPWNASSQRTASGGAGGAGGGFVDLTSGGDIQIFGTIDAGGGRGGNGRGWNNDGASQYGSSGGGGGGAGGGIRLLTPNDILLGASSVVTTAGGAGGVGALPYQSQIRNNGGMGGMGRIAMEDGDSVIAGQASASVTPSEGDDGFYRGIFDATRFKGGGLTPVGVTDLIAVGPFNPDYKVPQQADFTAGLPTAGAPGAGRVGILVEVRGYDMGADALPDYGSETDWFSVGWFKDIGVEILPEWNLGQPVYAGAPLPSLDNALHPASPNGDSGSGMDMVDGLEFIQVRFTFYLPSSITVSDPGGYVDNWTILFTSNQ